MKNLLIALSLFPLWGSGGLCAQTSVTVTPIIADYAAAPPTVKFKVSWSSRDANHRAKVWLFVDYRRVQGNAYTGDWLRAGIDVLPTATDGVVSLEAGNDKGFWLQGTDGAFAATVTVPVTVNLAGYAPRFGWCGIASDRPPWAEEKTGYYLLHGTPDFIIQTAPTNSSSTVAVTTAYDNCIYSLTDATGCPGEVPTPVISNFTASATDICTGQSVTLTATATHAELYSFDNGATWGSSASTVVKPTATTTYTLKVTRTLGACTVTYPVSRTVTVHDLPEVTTSNPAARCGAGEVTLTATAGGATTTAMTYTWIVGGGTAQTTTTGSLSYSAALGSTTYSVTVTNTNGCTSAAETGTITVHGLPTIALASGSTAQTVTLGAAITQITYNTTNAIDATPTGLPTGVTDSWSADVYTISGTPTAAGTYNYTVTTTNSNGCNNVSANGKITVNDSCTNCISWTYCAGFTMISQEFEGTGSMTWADADQTCQDKGPGWHLPTTTQLECMCKPSGSVGGVLGANIFTWSGTANADYANGTRYTNSTCTTTTFLKTSKLHVKCVK